MPRNYFVVDAKPRNETIIDAKTRNMSIVDFKPQNDILRENSTDRLYTMTLGVGMWLGFSAITYPTAITVTSSKSP